MLLPASRRRATFLGPILAAYALLCGAPAAAIRPVGSSLRSAAPPSGDHRDDAAAADSTIRLRRETVAMGTRLVVTVDAASRPEGLRATETALTSVERVEGLLSTWDPRTELSRLNAAPLGKVRRPSPALARTLAKAEWWARESGRAFEPAIGALVAAWDLREAGRRPDRATLAGALAATGPPGLRIDSRTGATERLRNGAWIDAGGFGKGAALAAVRDALRAHGIGSASVDLGGQVLTVGTPAGDPRGWPVAVSHPVDRQRAVATLRLCSVTVATSGVSERGIRVDGERLGHILDPHTGLPIRAWGSVSVVSADPLGADILATALFVLGPDAALEWARDRSLAVLVLETRHEDLRARWTPAMARWLVDAPGAAPDDFVSTVERRCSVDFVSSELPTEGTFP